jgi:hypothetical protein
MHFREALSFNSLDFIFVGITFVLLISILFPVEKISSGIFKRKRIVYISILISILLLVISDYIRFLLSFPLIVFSLFAITISFVSDRRYIYSLALILLALAPISLILGFEDIAEFFAQGCYLLLVLGVLKDIFYEKIFKE